MRRFVRLGIIICLWLASERAWAQQTVEEWQRKTVTDFPEIGISGSPMNVKFVQTVNALRVADPAFFRSADWPYRIAQQLIGAKPPEPTIIPGLTDKNPAAPSDANSDADANGTVSAAKLALDFKTAQNTASAKYAGRRLTVSGEILRIAQPENSTSAAFVYLKTGDGLPSIRVELNKMKKYAGNVVTGTLEHGKNGFEFRVNEGTLEVRSHETRSTYYDPFYYRRRSDSIKNGTWMPIISKGEAIKIVGTCSGMTYGITLSNAELQKEDLP